MPPGVVSGVPCCSPTGGGVTPQNQTLSPHRTPAVFEADGRERLRALWHQSPRTLGKATSRWTLALAAEVSFAQGLPL